MELKIGTILHNKYPVVLVSILQRYKTDIVIIRNCTIIRAEKFIIRNCLHDYEG